MTYKTPNQASVDKALAIIDSKLADGIEWSDAVWKAAQATGLSYEDIADAYDSRDGFDR